TPLCSWPCRAASPDLPVWPKGIAEGHEPSRWPAVCRSAAARFSCSTVPARPLPLVRRRNPCLRRHISARPAGTPRDRPADLCPVDGRYTRHARLAGTGGRMGPGGLPARHGFPGGPGAAAGRHRHLCQCGAVRLGLWRFPVLDRSHAGGWHLVRHCHGPRADTGRAPCAAAARRLARPHERAVWRLGGLLRPADALHLLRRRLLRGRAAAPAPPALSRRHRPRSVAGDDRLFARRRFSQRQSRPAAWRHPVHAGGRGDRAAPARALLEEEPGMKALLQCLLVLILLAAPARAETWIAPEEVTSLDNAILIDARGAKDYAAGHIPGAINVPWQSVADMNGRPGDPGWGVLLPPERLGPA